ncbi:MAG: hypothetical protein K0Q97_3026 [Bacillota bacterium]|jgi:uncharacterized YkwD family protein|nr:hypothetical protein [Bacillota bacterium]
MKKRIIALTLSAVLALSSTTAFAADTTTCTKGNYDLKGILNGTNLNYSNLFKQATFTVNGKTIDLNKINWKTTIKTETATPAPTKPAAVKPVVVKPAPAVPTTPVATKPAIPVAPVVTKPETTTPAAPVVTKPTTPVATKPAPTPAAPVTKPQAPSSNTVSSSNLNYEQKVVELVNIERQKNGLAALTMDSSVSNVARTKSKDMATNNYFAHQSPTYGSAGNMLTQFGVNWSAWGENIAYGQRTPEAVVTAWMNSSGHRANILNTSFTKIGVGYATKSDGTPYWTQMFTR